MAASPPTPRIALTTDFGTRDPWVAAMKGVIFSIAPDCTVTDLSHSIARQDILAGALFLAGAAPYFPAGTTHAVVVDPGVGSERLPIIAEWAGQQIICPDNGLLTLLERRQPVGAVHVIENPAFTLPEHSDTFHGRDIFAPAAAHAALGRPLAEFGPALRELQRIDIPEPNADADGQLHGEIIHVDRFGNCVTNILRDMVPVNANYRVQVAAKTLPAIHRTYSDVSPGDLVALFGSTGHLEIAVSMDSAMEALQLHRGSPVTLYRP